MGYEKGTKSEKSSPTIEDGNERSYANVLKYSIKKEESKKYDSFQNERRTNKMPRRPVTNINIQLFLGNCYVCNNFGHKAFDCRMNQKYNQKSPYKEDNSSDPPKGKSHNSFAPLQRYDKECYKCGNLGHIARNYTPLTSIEKGSTTRDKEKIKAWKIIEYGKEKCSIALCATKMRNLWHMDSGCSKHMIGDPSKFVNLKRD